MVTIYKHWTVDDMQRHTIIPSNDYIIIDLFYLEEFVMIFQLSHSSNLNLLLTLVWAFFKIGQQAYPIHSPILFSALVHSYSVPLLSSPPLEFVHHVWYSIVMSYSEKAPVFTLIPWDFAMIWTQKPLSTTWNPFSWAPSCRELGYSSLCGT